MKNIVGVKFGFLTVKSRSDKMAHLSDGDPKSLWNCKCDCGNKKVVQKNRFRNGGSRLGSILSCGCANKQKGLKLRKDPVLGSAKKVWINKYDDGCSFETFLKLSQQLCFWCGAAPSNKSNGLSNNGISDEWRKIKSDNPFIYNGLDRLDSSKDHSEDNIVPCCHLCNRAKMAMTVDQFRDWIKKVYKHQFES